MERQDHSRMTGPKIGLIVSTALASVALAGCTTSAAPRADTSFSKAQVALGKGQVDKAVTHAEAAVLAEPRNSGYRAMLGAAYLESGRFQSAATAFNDALELGDNDPRTVLSYALAKTAIGDNASAVAMLDDWSQDIDPADLGLAYALAGEPQRGVHVLTNALRGGQNTAKVRQNLAYTYALSGNWRAARVMAAEDVPAGEVNDRIAEWASHSQPEAYQTRVAGLLNVEAVADGGQPTHLALSNFPSQDMMVAEAAAQAPVSDVAEVQPSEVETLAFALQDEDAPAPAPAPAKKDAPQRVVMSEVKPTRADRTERSRYTSDPVVQRLPEGYRRAAAPAAPAKPAAPTRVAAAAPTKPAASRTTQRRMAPMAVSGTADTHMVQLGSFSTRADADRAWGIYKQRYPQLEAHDVVITKAEVNGKIYHRVAVAGFTLASARSMCSTVRSSGKGCFAYAKVNPPKGALDRGIRIAARTT